MEKHTVSASLTDNTKYMNRALPVKKSFDIIERTLIIGGQNSAFYFIDGFTKDEIMLKLMDSFLNISADDMPEDATSFSTSCIPYVEVDILGDFDSIFKNLLSGVTCLFIDGYEAAIAIDCRTYPSRSIEEPDKDKSLRGSRDGFVETIVFNTALMRRRIRDPHLIMEMYEAGTSTRTDVALCYMSDRVDRELLTTIQNKLEESKSQDLKMSQQSLAEALFQRKWYNPFPKYKFTERDGIGDLWKKVSQKFKGFKDGVVNFFTGKNGVVSKVTGLGGKIVTGLKNGLKNLKATFTNAFKGPLNGVIKLVNNMVGKINDKLLISVGSTLSNVLSALGVSVTNGQYQLFSIPTIPELEKGGVLKKGQVGLLEGKGAEAVVPLERNTQWISKVAAMMVQMLGGNGQAVNVTIPVYVGGKHLSTVVLDDVNQTEKKGRDPVAATA